MEPRLYIEQRLMKSESIELSESQAHYIRHVLRLKEGSTVLLFNGIDGEWQATLQQYTKHKATLACRSQTREQTKDHELALICALIKPNRLELMVEKATELGVTKIIPVISDYCSIRKLNIDRLRLHAIEAAEQSERLSVPEIYEPQTLRSVLANYKAPIIWADETRTNTKSIYDILAENKVCNILVGPEGGFSEKENSYLHDLENILPTHLGPLILRAETAAISMITSIQVISGTWR